MCYSLSVFFTATVTFLLTFLGLHCYPRWLHIGGGRGASGRSVQRRSFFLALYNSINTFMHPDTFPRTRL